MLLAVCVIAAASARVHELTPDAWHATVPGRRWLVYFAIDGCKHCARLKPMMEYVAESAPELRVGRVDATAHNGIARTYSVNRYPTILLLDDDGLFYEFEGRRSPPGLIAFARGGLVGGRRAPTELLANVSEWWLLAEAMWDPLKLAIKWSVGIALGIKLLATGCLWCLQRSRPPRARRPRRDEGVDASTDAEPAAEKKAQ